MIHAKADWTFNLTIFSDSRWVVTIAAGFSFLGGLIRALSTFPGIGDLYDVETQYYLALVGQVLAGVANPLAFCLPNMVSKLCAFSLTLQM
jgi:hypothetical protein